MMLNARNSMAMPLRNRMAGALGCAELYVFSLSSMQGVLTDL